MIHTKCLGGEYVNSGIMRSNVPENRIPWDVDFIEYDPPYFTSPGVKGKLWADPEQVNGLLWNQLVRLQ